LYSRSTTTCIGTGIVEEYQEEKFGRYLISTAADKRAVIKIKSIRSPEAVAMFPPSPELKTIGGFKIDDTILWSLGRLRLRESEPLQSIEKDLSALDISSFTTPEETFFGSTMTRENLIDLMEDFSQDSPGSPVFDDNDLESTFNELNSRLNGRNESSEHSTMIITRMNFINQ
jgi:hypothetical protein